MERKILIGIAILSVIGLLVIYGCDNKPKIEPVIKSDSIAEHNHKPGEHWFFGGKIKWEW